MHHKFSWELVPGVAADGLESPGSAGDGLDSAGRPPNLRTRVCSEGTAASPGVTPSL